MCGISIPHPTEIEGVVGASDRSVVLGDGAGVESQFALILDAFGDGHCLLVGFLCGQEEHRREQFFAHWHALDLDRVIVLAIFLVVLLTAVLLVLFFVLDLVLVLHFILHHLRSQLVQNVLNLSLELLIRVVHEIAEHLLHAHFIGFLLDVLLGEDAVQSAVDMCSHLEVLAFEKFAEHWQDVGDLRALLLA